MLEDLKLGLEELSVETRKIRWRQLEQALEALTTRALGPVKNLLARLHRLIADGKADPHNFTCLTSWAEVEDLIDDLIPLKRQLPRGLFWRVYLSVKDSKHRLEADCFDRCAVNQVEYVERALAHAVQKMESVSSM
jgi:hypothetical protein